MTPEQKLEAIRDLLQGGFDRGWELALSTHEDELAQADQIIDLYATMCENIEAILDS